MLAKYWKPAYYFILHRGKQIFVIIFIIFLCKRWYLLQICILYINLLSILFTIKSPSQLFHLSFYQEYSNEHKTLSNQSSLHIIREHQADMQHLGSEICSEWYWHYVLIDQLQVEYINLILNAVSVNVWPRPEHGILCILIEDFTSKNALLLFTLLRVHKRLKTIIFFHIKSR